PFFPHAREAVTVLPARSFTNVIQRSSLLAGLTTARAARGERPPVFGGGMQPRNGWKTWARLSVETARKKSHEAVVVPARIGVPGFASQLTETFLELERVLTPATTPSRVRWL